MYNGFMQKVLFAFMALIALSLALLGFTDQGAGTQNAVTKLDYQSLKTMIAQLGYEIKTLGEDATKPKYEIVVKTEGFTIPMGLEVSPSGNYVWITANLGKAPAAGSEVNSEFLRENGVIQPCQFYTTKSDFLMIGLPIDNRNIDSVVLRRLIDKMAGDVSDTSDLWQTE